MANSSTFLHAGKAFTCDALSLPDIDGVNGYVALYAALPPTFPGAWKAADNSYHPIADVTAWKAFMPRWWRLVRPISSMPSN